ncbi:hypothetical protein SAMN05216600_105154 [Pseudomonas cuatrocienegasensis]|uniref:Uncharacterized protein n=1 Tax=Pseudomonas cuatrocienegasensis TaxID=543360 RepID=A0ABY1BA40_9PSED|nr:MULTISPECIES: hypothetical protein [Pseudomonas]SEQ35818.1 hypothetical protein SAMN05216600_105154 [Pseudomonas cuatrocienegasensis]
MSESALGLVGQLDDALLDRRLGMTSTLPPAPDALLLPLLALSAAQWALALDLCVSVCAGSRMPRPPHLDEPTWLWCRRLGRALQPGHWLPESWDARQSQVAGLVLLRAWVGERLWQRLRITFARDAVGQAERLPLDEIPKARLCALWQAVGGYVLNTRMEEHPHVGQSQPDAYP